MGLQVGEPVARLVARLHMEPHEEGGFWCAIPQVQTADDPQTGRQTSGAIYYALLPGEKAAFHVIDCDEYWVHNAGDTLELWLVSPEGALSKHLLGTGCAGADGADADDAGTAGADDAAADAGCEPLVWIPAGTAFAARHLPGNTEGTLVTCITVPRFDYAGWRLLSSADLRALCPEAQDF